MSHNKEILIDTLIANSLDRVDAHSAGTLSKELRDDHSQNLRSLLSKRSLTQLIAMAKKDYARKANQTPNNQENK